SPRQHTRDNSLDRHTQTNTPHRHTQTNTPHRHTLDSDGDAPNRKGDVRRDDMLARRTSAGESRTFVPFNQFLPNRNVSAYVPTARRRSRPQDGEHGRYTHTYTHTGRGEVPLRDHQGPAPETTRQSHGPQMGRSLKRKRGVLGRKRKC
uniref:DUF4757 domain-containing protein n=1 Tax=Oncorhynchus mykiss TaxID=8022 RepID=A0A8K9V7H9_ONCMY